MRRASIWVVTPNVPKQVVTLLDGIKAKVGASCDASFQPKACGSPTVATGTRTKSRLRNRRRIAHASSEAVDVAQGADAIILVVGGSSAVFREGWSKTHMGDRATLDLIGEQHELADAIFALGKPVIVVLINGQPLVDSRRGRKGQAMVEGWYLGQEGGTAMADILFGDANPGGKLPVTIARSVGQLPMFYNQKPSAHRGYAFAFERAAVPVRIRPVVHDIRDRHTATVRRSHR